MLALQVSKFDEANSTASNEETLTEELVVSISDPRLKAQAVRYYTYRVSHRGPFPRHAVNFKLKKTRCDRMRQPHELPRTVVPFRRGAPSC